MIKWLKWLTRGEGVKPWLFLALLGIGIAWQGVSWHYGGGVVTFALDLGWDRLANLLLRHTVFGALLVVILGLFLLLFSFYRIIGQVVSLVTHQQISSLTSQALYDQKMSQGPKVVAIGGGTGLSNFLGAIKPLTANITAVVAVTDDGGSSGRLRRDLGILPPGDVRNCLISLSRSDANMERVLAYNFPKDSDLAGHNLGNLLMAAIMQSDQVDFAAAIEKLSAILAIQGKVLPSTVDNVVISGIMNDGKIVSGETNMVRDARVIKEVFLTPKDCTILPKALAAIQEADFIFIGPGSLYTSIITNLLVPKMIDALKSSKATVYYICNIANQPGEMEKTKASQYVKTINRHIGRCRDLIDKVIVNTGSFSAEQLKILQAEQCSPVICDLEKLKELKVQVLATDLIDNENLWKHNQEKLQALLYKEFNKTSLPWRF